jgi:hypothetical protein
VTSVSCGGGTKGSSNNSGHVSNAQPRQPQQPQQDQQQDSTRFTKDFKGLQKDAPTSIVCGICYVEVGKSCC